MNTLELLGRHGNSISVSAAGSGQPIVLLHGFPLDRRQWAEQVEPLSRRYHVLIPEMRGFGQSTLAEQANTIGDLADDVDCVREHLVGDEKFVLCGLSMGGYVAFEYWRRFAKRLSGLVLANTKPDADSDEAKAARQIMANQAKKQGAWPAVAGMLEKLISSEHLQTGNPVRDAVEAMLRACTANSIVAAQQAMAERADSIVNLPAMDLPTLVVTGQFDPIAPPAPTRKWAAVMPNSVCEVIPDAAHLTPLENPHEFNRVLLAFLDSNLS